MSSETVEEPLTFGDVDDVALPLAVLVHGFPDTPHTWRHLGPRLAAHGYRVVAPWLPGYDAPSPTPISVGTYVRSILAVRNRFEGDERALLVGHDWGANAGYGVTVTGPSGVQPFRGDRGPADRGTRRRHSALRAAAPVVLRLVHSAGRTGRDGAAGTRFLGVTVGGLVAGIRRSRGHRRSSSARDRGVHHGVISPYRSTFNPQFADPEAVDEAAATMSLPAVPTLYLHGARDGAIGADLLGDVTEHLPVPGSAFELMDDVGHFLHLEQPEALWAKISGWLAG